MAPQTSAVPPQGTEEELTVNPSSAKLQGRRVAAATRACIALVHLRAFYAPKRRIRAKRGSV
jgi:hypothetical protein